MRSLEEQEKHRNAPTETKSIYRGRYLEFKLKTYRFPDRTKTAEIVHHPGAVVLIPIDPSGNILLVRQWRMAADEIVIELPAGTLDPGENPIECAKRELREETGFETGKLTSLGGFYSAPGFCDEYLHLFLAEDLRHSPLPPDDDEAIDLMPVDLHLAKHLIETDQIRDAKTIAGILRYICLQK